MNGKNISCYFYKDNFLNKNDSNYDDFQKGFLSSRNKKIEFSKKINKDYINKLYVHQNSIDKLLSKKKFDIKALILKIHENNQKYLTRNNFINNFKNKKLQSKSMEKLKHNINNISIHSNKYPNKYNIYELVPEFNRIEEIDSNNYCEDTSNINQEENNNVDEEKNIINILKNQKNKNSNNKLINNHNNVLNNYKKNFSSLNDENEKENFRNLSIFKNANKLISDFKLIREYKNKFKKMDNITLFYYNKKYNKKQFNKSNIVNNNIFKKKSNLPNIVLDLFKKENKKLENSYCKDLNLDKIKVKIEKFENKKNQKKLILNKDNTLNKMKEEISEINKIIYESKFKRKNNLNKFSSFETQFVKSKSAINLN